ncbi:MAG TPA: hypothetical protein VFY10_10095 [Dehalococcoidia bacterium]|nr:hypothetical protein [Dehalococcoidia bacterium]
MTNRRPSDPLTIMQINVSRRRFIALGGAMGLGAFAAACVGKSKSGSFNGGSSGANGKQNLNVAVASYDLVAAKDNRFIAGLLTLDNDFVSFGTAQMRFSYLGTGQQGAKPVFFKEMTGNFLQIFGEGPATPPSTPAAGPASQGRGVYAVDAINFDKPGYWQVDVAVKTDNKGTLSGSAAFGVNGHYVFPAPGDKALASDSLTVNSTDVPPAAIDSRASSIATIPDASLHQLSIADALKQNKPLVVVFSTPVFCVSQFCGPITDMVVDIQKQFADKANFIHVEIWKGFQKQQINDTARDWLFRNGNLNEPWVYLIGADGTILNRWDNVATEGEIIPTLQKVVGA